MLLMIGSFFMSTVGRWILGALGIMVVLAFLWDKAGDEARAECELKNALAVAEAKAKIREELTRAVEAAGERAIEAEAALEKLKEEIDAIVQDAAKPPIVTPTPMPQSSPVASVCVPRDIAERLRALR